MVGVPLHDRIVLTNSVLPSIVDAALVILYKFIPVGAHRGLYKSMKHRKESAAVKSCDIHLELSHAHKGGPNVADNLEAYLLSGVGHLRETQDNEMDRSPE